MPYERDPHTIAWLEAMLHSELPRVRRRAVELLEYVDTDGREAWVAHAMADADPHVAATAALVSAVLEVQSDAPLFELLECDVVAGMDAPDLQWEWEYKIKVCRGVYIPSRHLLVWTREADDYVAKQIALMKAFPGERPAKDAVPVVIEKCAVTLFTRMPHSRAEAQRWMREGRPRYSGP